MMSWVGLAALFNCAYYCIAELSDKTKQMYPTLAYLLEYSSWCLYVEVSIVVLDQIHWRPGDDKDRLHSIQSAQCSLYEVLYSTL